MARPQLLHSGEEMSAQAVSSLIAGIQELDDLQPTVESFNTYRAVRHSIFPGDIDCSRCSKHLSNVVVLFFLFKSAAR